MANNVIQLSNSVKIGKQIYKMNLLKNKAFLKMGEKAVTKE